MRSCMHACIYRTSIIWVHVGSWLYKVHKENSVVCKCSPNDEIKNRFRKEAYCCVCVYVCVCVCVCVRATGSSRGVL